jgi:glucose-1-phosphate cytidylyltransferase
VHPGSRFGEIMLDGTQIASFHEKPQTDAGLINGGFMALSRRFIEEYLSTDISVVLEQDPMQRAVADSEMQAFVHEGFWQCMDTAREYQMLNQLWENGQAPWTEYWKAGKPLSQASGFGPGDSKKRRAAAVGYAA